MTRVCIHCHFNLGKLCVASPIQIDIAARQVSFKNVLYDLPSEELTLLETLGPDTEFVLCSDCGRPYRFPRSGQCGRCRACISQPLAMIEKCTWEIIPDPDNIRLRLEEAAKSMRSPYGAQNPHFRQTERTEKPVYPTDMAEKSWKQWMWGFFQKKKPAFVTGEDDEERRPLVEMQQVVVGP